MVRMDIQNVEAFPAKIILMQNQPAPETELLRAAYAAFNARDIDAALALMTPDVEWPRAFKGGSVHGPEEIRAYWTEQWGEVSPHVEPVAFHQENAGQSWSKFIRSCATWREPYWPINTLGIVSLLRMA
jgi:hypothetical protein